LIVVGINCVLLFLFFFNDTATTEIYTLSLHDALPISDQPKGQWVTVTGVEDMRLIVEPVTSKPI